MALATIDETGLHLPDYPTVLEDVKARFRGIYGDDLYLGPDSQDGQLCAVFALALHDAYTLAGSVYNAYSPATAQGTGLSRMVKINGLRRKPSGRSTVDLRLVGQAGTVIRGGMAGDAAGKRWLLPDEVAIPQSGEITVTATAEESGDIRAAAGDIVKILTPARGWQSVGNPAAALPGAAVETDAELRRRQAISTALPSLTVFEGTLGAVASIPGVTRSRGYENDGGVPDADGIPGHSICMVVEGGDTAAIAEAIAAKKGPGAGTYGTTEALVRDKFGVPNVIKFFRPVETPVYATVTIRPFPGYLSTTGESIRKNVAEHINGLNIGDDVFRACTRPRTRPTPPPTTSSPSRSGRRRARSPPQTWPSPSTPWRPARWIASSWWCGHERLSRPCDLGAPQPSPVHGDGRGGHRSAVRAAGAAGNHARRL